MDSIRVTWQIPTNDKRGIYLWQRLFGYKRKYNNKTYYYDGLLAKYVEETGEKLVVPNVIKKKNGDYIIPKKFEEKIKMTLLRLNIDHMIVPYDPITNFTNTLVSKSFGGTTNEE